jgi:hypothetical protein
MWQIVFSERFTAFYTCRLTVVSPVMFKVPASSENETVERRATTPGDDAFSLTGLLR